MVALALFLLVGLGQAKPQDAPAAIPYVHADEVPLNQTYFQILVDPLRSYLVLGGVGDYHSLAVYDFNLTLHGYWTYGQGRAYGNRIALDLPRGYAYMADNATLHRFDLTGMRYLDSWAIPFSLQDILSLPNGTLLAIAGDLGGDLRLLNPLLRTISEIPATGSFGYGAYFVEDPTHRRVIVSGPNGTYQPEIETVNVTSLRTETRAPGIQDSYGYNMAVDSSGTWLYTFRGPIINSQPGALYSFWTSNLTIAATRPIGPDNVRGDTLWAFAAAPHTPWMLVSRYLPTQADFSYLTLATDSLMILGQGTLNPGQVNAAAFSPNGTRLFATFDSYPGPARLVRLETVHSAELVSPPPGREALNATETLRVRWQSPLPLDRGSVGFGLNGQIISGETSWTEQGYWLNATAALTDGSYLLVVAARGFFGPPAAFSFSFLADVTGPVLSLQVPAQVSSAALTLRGSWASNQNVTAVRIDQVPAYLNPVNHTFSLSVNLRIGSNGLEFVSQDNYSRSRSTSATVRYTPQPVWHADLTRHFMVGVPAEYTVDSNPQASGVDFFATSPPDIDGGVGLLSISSNDTGVSPDLAFVRAAAQTALDRLRSSPGFQVMEPIAEVSIANRTGVHFAVLFQSGGLGVYESVYVIGSTDLRRIFVVIGGADARFASQYGEAFAYYGNHFWIVQEPASQGNLSIPVLAGLAVAVAAAVAAAVWLVMRRRRKPPTGAGPGALESNGKGTQ